MAELITLSGNRTRRQRNIKRAQVLEELMGRSYFDYIQATGKAIISPVVSPIKGVAHMLAETGRGIATGDLQRIGAAPFKGIGNTALSFYRDQKGQLEYYYRPSHMSVWMQPTGSALTAAGTVPTPASPFLLAAGTTLTTVGTIGSNIYAKDRARKAGSESEKQKILTEQRNKNIMYMGIAAIGAGALIYTMV